VANSSRFVAEDVKALEYCSPKQKEMKPIKMSRQGIKSAGFQQEMLNKRQQNIKISETKIPESTKEEKKTHKNTKMEKKINDLSDTQQLNRKILNDLKESMTPSSNQSNDLNQSQSYNKRRPDTSRRSKRKI
jgi:hypothetical protein